MVSKKKLQIIVVLITFALSSLSATIVFPLFAPLFLSQDAPLFKAVIPEYIKSILYALFLVSFPLAQFLFSPVVGAYSDRSGRKKAFLLTLFLEFVGYLLSGFGIEYKHLSLLFFGRFLTGLGAANFSVCLATLTDISEDQKKRNKYFAIGSGLAGIMFVMGPFLGGRLSEKSINPAFSLSFPLYVGAILALLNLLLFLATFKETREIGKFELFEHQDPLSYTDILFSRKSERKLFFVFFLFLFAWNTIYLFLPALLVEQFNLKGYQIGDLTALMGVVWFFGSLLTTLLSKIYKKTKFILMGMLIFFAAASIFIPFPSSLKDFIGVSALSILFAGSIWPLIVGAISRNAPPGLQGKILGITQSIQALSMILAPIFGGFFLEAHSKIPFIFSSFSTLLALVFLFQIKTKHFDV
jgi:DHA1 family tetracycline resistance protein-like MFS transporter